MLNLPLLLVRDTPEVTCTLRTSVPMVRLTTPTLEVQVYVPRTGAKVRPTAVLSPRPTLWCYSTHLLTSLIDTLFKQTSLGPQALPPAVWRKTWKTPTLSPLPLQWSCLTWPSEQLDLSSLRINLTKLPFPLLCASGPLVRKLVTIRVATRPGRPLRHLVSNLLTPLVWVSSRSPTWPVLGLQSVSIFLCFPPVPLP